jgi:hypothetical protein
MTMMMRSNLHIVKYSNDLLTMACETRRMREDGCDRRCGMAAKLAAREAAELDPFARCMASMGTVASRPASARKMAWLMPRMAKAVPYLGYIVVAGTEPT